MKERFPHLACRVAFATARWLASTGVQGGEFINLGFNDPDLSNAYYDADRGATVAPVLEALRGWSVNPLPAELPYGGLIGVVGGLPFGLARTPPEVVDKFGAYRLNMSIITYPVPGSPPRPAISIFQSGTVPSDAAALQFFESREFDVPIEVYLSGARQSVSTLDTSLTLKGVDVSAFAGAEVNLEFRFPEGMLYTFDILGFFPVPEPTTWVLMMVGGAGLLALKRKRR